MQFHSDIQNSIETVTVGTLEGAYRLDSGTSGTKPLNWRAEMDGNSCPTSQREHKVQRKVTVGRQLRL